MYNVPFQLSNFNPSPQTTQQPTPTSSSTKSATSSSNDRKPFTTTSSPIASLDSSPTKLLQQTGDMLTSPTPSHKATPTLIYDTRQPAKETYYTNNDWVTSPTTTTKTDLDSTDLDNYGTSPNLDEEVQQQQQQQHMQQLFEKKRRRRESHNAVERRRRDNINERIFELSALLPERDAIKNNKGTILRKSVEHIRVLHEQVNKCQHRIHELETMLGMYRGGLDLQQRPMMQSAHNNTFSTSIQPQLAYRRNG